MKKKKTNAMRILEAENISYEALEYEYDENDLSGLHAAEKLNQDPNQIFKTLLLEGVKHGYFICCIPVNREVDLKKAAHALKDKKAALVPLKLLNPVTGYIRGGCSPIGLKKKYPIFIDESALNFNTIGVSAGERGKQMFLSPKDLAKACKGEFCSLT